MRCHSRVTGRRGWWKPMTWIRLKKRNAMSSSPHQKKSNYSNGVTVYYIKKVGTHFSTKKCRESHQISNPWLYLISTELYWFYYFPKFTGKKRHPPLGWTNPQDPGWFEPRTKIELPKVRFRMVSAGFWKTNLLRGLYTRYEDSPLKWDEFIPTKSWV